MANYIDNKKFEELIRVYFTDDRLKVQDELFEYFDKIIDGVMSKFNFKIDKEEAKQECYYLILRILKNFDPKNGAAFNYFTTVIVNNMRLIYTKNKKYLEKMRDYVECKLGNYSPSSANIEPV